MPKWITCLFLILTISAFSENKEVKDLEKNEIPSVEQCIPAWVSKTDTPSLFPFHNALVTAVIAENKTAQIHTLQGLNHLHGGWDFEAIRHFSVAIKADPKCVLAHWGMVMSMLSTSPETTEYRLAATQRLLQLITDGEGTDLERRLAYSLVKYIEEGSSGAESAFNKTSRKYPSDIQSKVFASLFSRGGYDQMGEITPAQERAEKSLLALTKQLPNNSLPLHALLLIKAEAPELKSSLKLAEKLCELIPNYPPYLYLLGHYQWRCGEFSQAAVSFELSEKLFAEWMEKNHITPADCPEWILAKCYRIVALASNNEFDKAIELAKKLSEISLDSKRPLAPGTRQLLWNTQALASRILMYRAGKGDHIEALTLLPTPDKTEFYRRHSLSYWWIDGLRIALKAHHLIDTGKISEAAETVEVLNFHGHAMAMKQQAASANGEYSEWRRSFLSLEILTASLRGRLALAGTKESQGSAFNWFRAATDRQRPATAMNPPLLISSMACQLGDYFLTSNQPAKAIEAYQEAIFKFPNELRATEGLRKATALRGGN